MKRILFCLLFLFLSRSAWAQTPTEPTRTAVLINSSVAWIEIVDHVDTGLTIALPRGSTAAICLARSLDCTTVSVSRCPIYLENSAGNLGWAYVSAEGWHRKICGRLVTGSASDSVETEGWK